MTRPFQTLFQIADEVDRRVQAITESHEDWPCRKGCADCCRSLAAEPRVSFQEWSRIAEAIEALPAEIAQTARRRIRESADGGRPVVCPLLEDASGTCLIYDARPIACRAYGFYAERAQVLGCSRIEDISRETPDVVWGNHAALNSGVEELGPARTFSGWIEE